MPLFDSAAVSSASSRHPTPPNTIFEYGTAGFRTKAHLLDSVIFRVGLLASLRSKKCSSKAIGVMVTASHNPEEDNGVKLVDPRGEMLQQSWEKYATRLANATDDRQLIETLEDIAREENVPGDANANVVYAMDTRPSGPALIAALEDGIEAAKAKGTNYGIMTTPQLHYITRCLNTQGTPDAYGEPTEQGYYKKLAAGFKELVSGLERLPPLRVDCANGVGAPKLSELAKHIGENLISVNIENANIGVKGKLNFECGADFVKVGMKLPRGLENLKPGDRACALDGDADRIVYFYFGEDKAFHLLDGDKISGLAAMFIMDLVRTAGIPGINVGVVQTAYANGRSTKYLKDVLKVPVACTETGVKHLHHAAEEYDVGVYFEANGHGTVVFSEHCLKAIRSASGSTTEQKTAIRRLGALTEIINQTVGDALSDLLLVEAILTIRQWKASDWDAAYTDKPSRLVKVLVEDRGKFKTADADRVLTEPKGLQEKIEQAAGRVNEGRSFVRPSGTEDCVRVYAEAATREECDRLAYTVAGLVYDLAGGKGGRPKEFL